MSYQVTDQDIKEAVVLPEWERTGIRYEPCKGLLGWLGYYSKEKVPQHIPPLIQVRFPRLEICNRVDPPIADVLMTLTMNDLTRIKAQPEHFVTASRITQSWLLSGLLYKESVHGWHTGGSVESWEEDNKDGTVSHFRGLIRGDGFIFTKHLSMKVDSASKWNSRYRAKDCNGCLYGVGGLGYFYPYNEKCINTPKQSARTDDPDGERYDIRYTEST